MNYKCALVKWFYPFYPGNNSGIAEYRRVFTNKN